MAFANVEELFAGLKGRFRADKAQGDKATLSIILSDENYWITVDNGTMDAGKGNAPGDPDLILRAKADDFVKIMNGEMNAMTAFMQGKVKAEKNMGLAVKLMGWFGMG
ncbi:MAG TPA: SCP2 sterol-binding domain-containing protein [Aggregatilineales bacterium]|nr:SCP2 sterol-binding domain-containing protein [Anaerolineales bacterium]HRE46790.1 SCP2 sterol-binding domain-containing protein [Aggregatilineales bacterium]